MPRFQDIPQVTQDGHYRIHVSWDYLLEHLENWMVRDTHGLAALDINPEFQRGHVWTKQQQIAYVEFELRGGVGSDELRFNCVGWGGSYKGPFVLVDGKQRLEAVCRFLRNEIPSFSHYFSEYTDQLRINGPHFEFRVNNLETEKQVLQWYLEMNDGGTPHTEEELNKVRKMLEKA